MGINRLIKFSITCALSAALPVLMSSCKHEKNELSHSHSHNHNHEYEHDHEPTHEHHEATGAEQGEIVLQHDRAHKLGVEAALIEPKEFYETITVGGELIPSPSQQATVASRSAGIVTLSPSATLGTHIAKGQTIATVSGKGMAGGDANEAARVALTAAKRELDRITPLHADGIVSTRDYNAALQAYESAKAAAGNGSNASGSTAIAPASGTLTQILVSEGQFVDAGTPIAIISGSTTLSLKANLPERNAAFLPSIGGARFRTSYTSDIHDIADFNGHRSSDHSNTVATQGYIPVYFTLTNDGSLTAGSFCEIYLLGNKREGIISVPVSALSEQQGQYFVYVKLDDDCYEKRPVTTGASAGDTIEIRSGVIPGEKVVTEGVTFVRLAESSGVVPEGHSHNH